MGDWKGSDLAQRHGAAPHYQRILKISRELYPLFICWSKVYLDGAVNSENESYGILITRSFVHKLQSNPWISQLRSARNWFASNQVVITVSTALLPVSGAI